jgi:hypothetical protein
MLLLTWVAPAAAAAQPGWPDKKAKWARKCFENDMLEQANRYVNRLDAYKYTEREKEREREREKERDAHIYSFLSVFL